MIYQENNTGRRTAEEVASRYSQLSPKVKSSLGDFGQYLIVLRMIAYGNDVQRDIAMQGVNESVNSSRKAFADDPVSRIRERIQNGEITIPQLDLEHIAEASSLLQNLNTAAKNGNLNQDIARQTYNLLYHYMYGVKQ